ncbi:MFS transporter [Flexivirga endophytica]|uniref:MFS transporter n=1 Tax=Flexivirga endophytica TaxID=1849103 RepID=A0A916SW41_9MICO|nr:MFS transporter [Flexivirga endophytica]GGB19611.1 MFS transporter [Flexivirga endophytica]GHB36088.1 MFS transporter [Flexivirga endophytica]
MTEEVRRWIAVAAIALTTLVVGLDTMVLNVALPTLSDDLHADISALQWVTSGYTLSLAVFMLPLGALGDRIGRRRVLIASLAIFGVASLACAYAQSPGQLIAARVLLGVGAASLLTLTLAVITVMFPDKTEQRRAIGLNMAGVALGMPLGPLLGGWLLDHFWWGSVFLVNVPVVLIAIAALVIFVPESRSADARAIHLPSVVLSSVGLAGLTYGFIELGSRGWGDVRSWTFAFVGTIVLGAFLTWQRHLTNPLIDSGLFRVTGFTVGATYAVLLNFVMFGVFFSLPQYFQAVRGTDALGSGLRLLPMVVGLMLATRLNEPLLRRVGVRGVLITGFLVVLASTGIAVTTGVHTPYAVIACWMTVLGVGMGIVMFTTIGWAAGTLDAERAGAGTALLSALRQVGGTLGIAVLGTVQASSYHDGLGRFDHEPLRDSVSAGVAAARAAGDSSALHAVRRAFVDSMDALLWCTGGLVLVALVSVLVARGAFRERAELPDEDDAPQLLHAAR